MTRRMRSEAASPTACTGPLPPKASISTWRISLPRCVETARMAAIMFELAMSVDAVARLRDALAQALGQAGHGGVRLVGIDGQGAAGQGVGG